MHLDDLGLWGGQAEAAQALAQKWQETHDEEESAAVGFDALLRGVLRPLTILSEEEVVVSHNATSVGEQIVSSAGKQDAICVAYEEGSPDSLLDVMNSATYALGAHAVFLSGKLDGLEVSRICEVPKMIDAHAPSSRQCLLNIISQVRNGREEGRRRCVASSARFVGGARLLPVETRR
nr:hypothetical protein [Enterorhabdus sp. P55]